MPIFLMTNVRRQALHRFACMPSIDFMDQRLETINPRAALVPLFSSQR